MDRMEGKKTKEVPEFNSETVIKIAARHSKYPSYLKEAEAALDEWLGDAIKDGNCTAAEAFGLAIHLIRERVAGR